MSIHGKKAVYHLVVGNNQTQKTKGKMLLLFHVLPSAKAAVCSLRITKQSLTKQKVSRLLKYWESVKAWDFLGKTLYTDILMIPQLLIASDQSAYRKLERNHASAVLDCAFQFPHCDQLKSLSNHLPRLPLLRCVHNQVV